MDRMPGWLRQHLAALRAVAVLTVLLGLVYPLVTTGVAQALFHHQANGSLVEGGHGSSLIGQSFTDADGNPVRKYFQSRPSAAGDGYDPTSTSAGNLGPEDVIDTPDRKSLLTQVCTRSKAIGELEGVSGARPYCTPDGVGAVLKVFPDKAVSVNQACPAVPFVATYEGRRVECARPGEDYAAGRTVPVRGDATAVVPADAVTASGSGLDPHISLAYAELQAPRVAKERGLDQAEVERLIRQHTTGRALGFMGEPAVNVLELNLALDRS
ncbi:Potassium-transporting ATPase C chain (TC 3.A.3.7.1) [[Actinomadura] parvosata subsp. kistnae]|uniref:Potassium-transporting ATPase KdpC subunit n=1 Tax=[Actinomadura] parvosata subsp. kistnae TaxID=1909395 RepID=A0A1V0AH09_9ACTN|nr:potassium-transporting ATPase subunit C [Nonomuraea sp. ATCC 55076]AQZ69521.1 K+-transporting ATPase subunit C [Nonomuraea sp. ATCC 55076]SPL91810.1 Potassium-transporting ATPase C chain (TC 3.A.3.7.1) [Actinomadura parvosata subsp. kistnae]